MFPFRHIFTSFIPYQSGRSIVNNPNAILLDTNENPFPHDGKNRYPDPYHAELSDYIAHTKSSQFSVKISKNNIVLGNGSDELIDLLIRLFCEPTLDSICISSPTFGMYGVSAKINNVKILDIPLKESFELDIKKVLSSLSLQNEKQQPKLLFLCHPNNPTGNTIPETILIEIFEATKNTKTMVVIDEAYIDYCTEESTLKYLKKYPHIIVLHTFSKMWGLAGCRVGCMIAHPEVIEKIKAIKSPYNVSTLNANAVKQQINQKEKLFQERNEILSQKFWMESQLQKQECIKEVYPSKTNFLLVRFNNNSLKVYNRLLNHDIIIRNFSSVQSLENCLRITLGTDEENKTLLSFIQQYTD